MSSSKVTYLKQVSWLVVQNKQKYDCAYVTLRHLCLRKFIYLEIMENVPGMLICKTMLEQFQMRFSVLVQ